MNIIDVKQWVPQKQIDITFDLTSDDENDEYADLKEMCEWIDSTFTGTFRLLRIVKSDFFPQSKR